MALTISIRQGGDSDADTIDVTDQVPIFDIDSEPQLTAGMGFGDGSDEQSQFRIIDDENVFRTADTAQAEAHNLVTITEDAPGYDVPLAIARVARRDEGRGDLDMGVARELEITLEGINADIRGTTLVEAWVRGAETGTDRIIAMGAEFLDGTWRPSTVITCEMWEASGEGHLVKPNALGGEVMMEAITYEVGTSLDEIIRDCAETEGQKWGVVIHHGTGESHACFQYCEEDDWDVYPAPVAISDDPAEVDNSTTYAPIWDAGAALLSDGQDVLSGIVSEYGDQQAHVVYEDAAAISRFDRWIQKIPDATTTTEAGATARAPHLLRGQSREYLTHQVTLKLRSDQVNKLAAGMSIEISAAASRHDEGVGGTATRRIAGLKWEPCAPEVGAVDGFYYAHLELDRPKKIARERRRTRPGPRAPQPSTPPSGGTPDDIIAQWHFDSSGEDDDANGWFWNLWSADNGGCVQSGSLNPGISMDDEVPASAATQYTITASVLNRSLTRNPAGVQFYIEYIASGGSEISEALLYTTTTNGFETFTTTITTPALTAGIEFNVPNSLAAVDNVIIQETGTGTPATPGTPGDIHPDLTNPPTNVFAPIRHTHTVFRDEPPTVDDDEDEGYPITTRWVQFDDISTPTQIVAIYILQEDDDGAAVWFQEPAPPHVHEPEDILGSPANEIVDHGTMGAAETFDFSAGSDHAGILDQNLTVTLTGAVAGERAFLTLVLTQDGSGGNSIDLPASVVNAAELETAFDDEPNAVNILTLFTDDGGTVWYAFLAGGSSGGGGASATSWIVDPGTPGYSGSGPVVVALTSVFGIDSGGNPYYNAANVTDGEEAALVWDSVTGTYSLRPYYP